MDEIRNSSAPSIRAAMYLEGVKLANMAELCGCTVENLEHIFRRNDLRESQIRLLADKIGYDVRISLVSRNTGEEIATYRNRPLADNANSRRARAKYHYD